jgi:Zn-dependent protease
MSNNFQGSFRLFRIVGINVYLHWSWFIVAVYEIQGGTSRYSSILWNMLEYLALFLIVLLHEFGHSLACRQTGGQADEIVLWPLGGIAYVSPPQRPGATLWSIAAGPLVNVALLPVFSIILLAARTANWAVSMPNADVFFYYLWWINLILLVFNLLPIYPLDGGQILRSLLWFIFGKNKSLMIAAIIGFIGVGFLLLLALWRQSIWFGILAAFILMNCWNALKHARLLIRAAKTPRHEGYACPHCQSQPPRGAFCICSNCQNYYDPFATNTSCPHCMTPFAAILCPDCSETTPIHAWSKSEASNPD